MSDTPRTDEMEDRCCGKDHLKSYHLMRNLAQELELELADAPCCVKGLLALQVTVTELQEQRDTLVDALRKAVAWGDTASMHILYRESINWELLDEARETLNANLIKP